MRYSSLILILLFVFLAFNAVHSEDKNIEQANLLSATYDDSFFDLIKKLDSTEKAIIQEVQNTPKTEYNITMAQISANNAKRNFGENSMNYANALNNLATAYMEIAYFDEAEPVLLKAINIYKNNRLISHKNLLFNDYYAYAVCLNNTGTLYSEIGNYKKAKEFKLLALSIYEKEFGKKHEIYAEGLCELAEVYENTGKVDDAYKYYLESLEIMSNRLGSESSSAASILKNIAYFELNKGNVSLAQQHIFKALEVFKNVEINSYLYYSEYAPTLLLSARINIINNELSKAEKQLIEAKEIFKNKLGKSHIYYAHTVYYLAKLYSLKNEKQKALSHFKDYFEITKSNIIYNIYGKTENEIELYQKVFNLSYYSFLTFCSNYYDDKDIIELAYDNLIFMKGQILNWRLKLKSIINISKDKDIVKLAQKVNNLKKSISFFLSKP